MRAVWSFWSKPYRAHDHLNWSAERHTRLSWILSVETSRRHFAETALVTDSAGARMLVDELGLAFDSVSTALDALDGHDPEWWALGKIYAYRAQEVPFVHIDHDAFLWKPLPPEVVAAGVLTQSPESLAWYDPGAFDWAIGVAGGWLPEEWRWFRRHPAQEGLCCGIFGGNHIPFINHYADSAIRMIEHPANQPAWSLFNGKLGYNILFEQYFLSAALAFHQASPTSPLRDVTARCLFATGEQAYDEATAVELGFTHLLGGAKRDPGIMRRLKARVARDYPQHYARYVRTLPGATGLLERIFAVSP
jgi:hypothetical protein